ncbi:MAG: DUF3783 domain-containing protein [Clostridiales bacterium]|nr:DUF3783 domain-containing protein [Clostridiales bacterium]
MSKPQGLVLYYNASAPQEAARARLVFIRMGLRVKQITEEDLGQAVGSFAGLEVPPPPAAAPVSIEESILVFSGLPGRALDQTLAALRKAGIPRSVYKAVLTPGNAAWSFYQLYQELCNERQAIEQSNSPD